MSVERNRRVRAVLHHMLALGAAAWLVAACTPEPERNDDSTAMSAAFISDAGLVERGRLLALLGNCGGCHSRRDDAPYAGGAPLRTPFGMVHAGNLTPDAVTGLGRWSADDFWRALHHGRGRDGRALVPAFPYTSYTHVTRDDSDALFAYLRSLPPVARATPPQALRFPYGSRIALAAWQWLFFEPADLAAEAAARAALPPRRARGAYLVDGLGHCAACHAPRNLFGAPAREARGGDMPGQHWHAPSLHPTAGAAPAVHDLVALLKTGQSAAGYALGPMASVVLQSTQHWPEDDLQAVAEHLAALPPDPPAEPAPPAPSTLLAQGRQLYEDHCADCHGAQGEGAPGAYPALAGNATVLQASPRNLVQVLRYGGFAPTTATHPRPYGMPPSGLGAQETATVLTYLRQAWGHRASAVSELDVLRLR